MADLILASSSPRRRELMALTGLDYIIDAPDVDETCDLPAREAVGELACRKARAAAALHPGEVVLAADTLVSLEGKALGKPHDEEEAFRMLSSLQGRWHQVYTGVTVVDRSGVIRHEVDASEVRFGAMTEEEIRQYIATGEPMDKAGAYALQGIAGLWIEEVRGSHTGIIGLPLAVVRRLLRESGLQAPKTHGAR